MSIEILQAQLAELRRDLHRERARAWREAAMYLRSRDNPALHDAAERLDWYCTTHVDYEPPAHQAMTG